MCHQEKPEADFAFRSIATGVRQDHCRVCHAAYRRQHYLDNREEYIAREVARMKRIAKRTRCYSSNTSSHIRASTADNRIPFSWNSTTGIERRRRKR
jgi:hypothetical protein